MTGSPTDTKAPAGSSGALVPSGTIRAGDVVSVSPYTGYRQQPIRASTSAITAAGIGAPPL